MLLLKLIHTSISRLARSFAILGGLVLCGLVMLTCLSVAGRSLNAVLHADVLQTVAPGLANALLAWGIGPVNGDFELVEAGMAFTIFAFLPLCQLTAAHASVDIFTAMLPRRVNQLLRLLIETVFAAVLILIAIQLFAGMESKRASGQTTFLLQFPLWWGYALCVPGAVAAAVVSLHIAACRVLEVVTGRTLLPPDVETVH